MMLANYRDTVASLNTQFLRNPTAKASLDVSTELQTVVEIDTEKITVETSWKNREIVSSGALARVINRENAKNTAGGFVLREGRLTFQTCSPFVKPRFPQQTVTSMLSLHHSAPTLSCFRSILQSANP